MEKCELCHLGCFVSSDLCTSGESRFLCWNSTRFPYKTQGTVSSSGIPSLCREANELCLSKGLPLHSGDCHGQGAVKRPTCSSVNCIKGSLVGVVQPEKVLAASLIVLHLSQKLMGNHSIKRSAVEYTKSQYEFRRMRAAHQRHAKAQLCEMIYFFFISTDFLGEIR